MKLKSYVGCAIEKIQLILNSLTFLISHIYCVSHAHSFQLLCGTFLYFRNWKMNFPAAIEWKYLFIFQRMSTRSSSLIPKTFM
jgi:hypothetical protein